MSNIVLDLEVDRVDLVNEGANSAAFIRLYKGKENVLAMTYDEILKSMKPEHADVIKAEIEKAKTSSETAQAELLTKANADLQAASEDLAKAKEKLAEIEEKEKLEKSAANVEDVIKSLDPAVQEVFKSIKAQKEAAEAVVKSLQEAEVEKEAVAKAADLKGLPTPQEKLVEIVKTATPEVYGILKAASDAIVNGGIFEEVGKTTTKETSNSWDAIEKKADEIAKRDTITKEAAISKAVRENPDLYKAYIAEGGKE